jgi:hypothetical protein
MKYETVEIINSDQDIEVVEVHRYPTDLVVWNPTLDPQSTGAPVRTRIVVRRYTGRKRVSRPVSQSPRQDATSASKAGQGPKTRGGTNEFISAYWVKGKPKCRKGYRYDFKRKMCVKKS